MIAILRLLAGGVLAVLKFVLDIGWSVYEWGNRRTDAAELDRRAREKIPQRRQADAEQAARMAEAEIAELEKAREAIEPAPVPETDREGEDLAERLRRKLQ